MFDGDDFCGDCDVDDCCEFESCVWVVVLSVFVWIVWSC